MMMKLKFAMRSAAGRSKHCPEKILFLLYETPIIPLNQQIHVIPDADPGSKHFPLKTILFTSFIFILARLDRVYFATSSFLSYFFFKGKHLDPGSAPGVTSNVAYQ